MGDDTARVRLLGGVSIERSRSEEPLNPRLRRLLAVLSVDRGETVSESALIDAVWGESGELPANPTRSLQTYVSRLRSHLGAEAVERVGAGYRLAEGVSTDVVEFEALLGEAREARSRADDRSAVDLLERANGLWDGPALGDLADESWAGAQAHRLDELRVDAREQRAELLIGLGDVNGALLGDLKRLAIDHPHREGPTRLLMIALNEVGRQADALTAFRRHRDQLATDLGLEPSPGLRKLEEQILTEDPAARTAGSGRALRGYRIRERLGEGAFSIVYRGEQPSVGREVAIKQIRAELANRPEFIRRFETEAHLVARLEHPHIVPLIDYWREPGSAYLVMRLLRGGNLETSVLEHPWTLDRTLAMVDQIGAGLAVAHRAGVVHRDVKSANILLDDESNAYLSDFGIALEASEIADPLAALSAGSPAYASPEQLRREPIGPPADVHGLAIAVYEALTGRLPFPDEPNQAALLQRQLHDPIPPVRHVRSDLPTAIDDVLGRATAKAPTDRYQTVEEFVEALHQAANVSGPAGVSRAAMTAITAEVRNPYKGLRAFDEADAADFAGRERLVDQLAETLDQNRLIAVVGPSGSGKSSVVRAGLLPQLRKGRLNGSDRWYVVTMVPGQRPFEELENGLTRISTNSPMGLLELLRDGERGIGRSVRRVLPDDGQLLLVIDQFEELFTLCEDETARREFLDGLASAVTEERSRLRVILTLRADFYDRPLRYESIGRLVRDATIPILPLAADELERAIVDPALRVGCEFEPGLISEIVADVADQPGALPMLQYALTELYERRVSGLLLKDAYRDLGGVAGALARRAEELHSEAGSDEQTAIRAVFGRLVTPGEGTEDTRRRALRSELTSISRADTIIDLYGAARLVSFDHDPATREPTVEVAHEALIRQWPRLREWLDEDRDGLRIMRHLHTAAHDWDATGRPDTELYRGGRLETAEDWATTNHLGDLERAFVDASSLRRNAERVADRRQSTRLRRLVAGVAVIAVVAVVAGAVAFQQRSQANDSAAEARAQAEIATANEQRAQRQTSVAEQNAELAAAARADADLRRILSDTTLQRDTNPTLALLLAAEAHQAQAGAIADVALWTALQRTDGYLGLIAGPDRTGNSNFITFLGDDAIIVRDLDKISIYSVPARRQIFEMTAGSRPNVFGRTSIFGHQDRAITVTDDGRALLFDSDNILSGPVDLSGDMSASGAGLGADGTVLVGYENGELWRIQPESGGRVKVGQHPHPIDIATASADGRLVAAVDAGGNVTLWDTESGEPRWTWTTGDPPSWDTSVEPRLDAAGNNTGETRYRGLRRGGPVLVPPVEGDLRGAAENLWFSADGRYLYLGAAEALAVEDGAFVWTAGSAQGANSRRFQELADGSLLYGGIIVRDGQVERELEQFELSNMIAASPSGSLLAELSEEGLRLWSTDGTQLIADALPRGDHDYATLSEDGRQVASFRYLNPDGTVEPGTVRSVATGEKAANLEDPAWFQVFTRHGHALSYYVLQPDIQPDGTSVFRDPKTFEALSAPMPQQAWAAAELSPDGKFVAIGDIAATGGVRIYDAETAELLVTLADPLDPSGRCGCYIAFSPDSSLIAATVVKGGAALWSTATWEPVAVIEPPDADLYSVAFSRNGEELLTSSAQGVIYSYKLATGQISTIGAVPFEAGAFYHGVAIAESPDDDYLVVTGRSAALIDRSTGSLIGTPVPAGELAFGASASLNGQHAVTATQDHLLVWNLQPDTWPETACNAAGRNMTAEEWQQYGPTDRPYRATCPQWPPLG